VGSDGRPVSGYALSISREGSEEPLRTIKGKQLPKSLRWDGKNQFGRLVPDGAYTATLRIFSTSGELVSSARVEVDTRRPSLGLDAYPRIFEPGSADRPVGLDLKTANLAGIPARWEVLVEGQDGRRVRLLEGRGNPPEHLNWDGKDDRGALVARESIYYLSYLLEMDSGATAKTSRQVLGSEVTAFKESGAIKVNLAAAKFASGEEGMALEEFPALKEAAEAVKKYGSSYLVQVLGHSDSDESKAAPLELSFQRAKAVRDFLVNSGGLDPERVKAMGFGSERPAGDESTEAGKAKNRRVDVILFTK
jgi:outer membrane protein OmpA-like peptidoglycan-associated protein